MKTMLGKSMIAALGAMALAGTVSSPSEAQPRGVEQNSPQVRATALTGRHTYAETVDALLAADIDHVLSNVRRAGADEPPAAAESAVLVMDELAAGRTTSARATLEAMPEKFREGARNLLESWIYLKEGDSKSALSRARVASEDLPGRLGALLPALLTEASGDLAGADRLYDGLVATLNTAPPGEDEPSSVEEALHNLSAPQITQILYRAALVKHRLGDKDAARTTYGLVEGFAPNSPDTAANIVRLDRGEAPIEPPLDYVRGLARWSLFISEEFGRSEGLAQIIMDPTRKEGLVSPSAALFAQMGIALDPSASDWALGSGYTLLQADGLDGAERLFKRISKTSVYAPDAAIGLAETALKRKNEARAVAEAQRALKLAPDRWSVATAAANIFTRAHRDAAALDAYGVALDQAKKPKDRANILISRASAHNFLGNVDQAVADGRAALAVDGRPSIKIALIGILMESDKGWPEAVQIGRQLLAEKPDSVSRLNQLGYTLIQRPEGLEEGFRLLSRGVALGETDYAVVDSLGWAYYLYGDFESARRLVELANSLSPEPIAEILDHLGDIAWREDKKEEARATWRRALEARPEAKRRTSLQQKIDQGLLTPAPERRTPPELAPMKAGQRSDT